MKKENRVLWGCIGGVFLGLVIALVIAAQHPDGSKTTPTQTPNTSATLPTTTPKLPPPPEKQVFVDGEKLMMPFGKPEVVTFCYKGIRMFYGFYDSRSYGGVTQTLWGTPDAKCPQE